MIKWLTLINILTKSYEYLYNKPSNYKATIVAYGL